MLGPALVACLLMARYLLVATLVTFGLVLSPFLWFGDGHGSLPPPWQLGLGPSAVEAAALIGAGVSAVAAALCGMQARRPTVPLRWPALACSALGLLVALGGSWLR